jgi:uncharacterized membrane protein YphA (DoxX/SURF4 family)
MYDVNMKALFTHIDSLLNKGARFVPLLLRLGLAVVFIYAAVSSTLTPNEWIGYLPAVLTDMFPAEVLLKVFSVFELFLAVWLLSGVYVRYGALLAALTLTGIVVSNFSLFAISFRDIGLICAALALAVSPEKQD